MNIGKEEHIRKLNSFPINIHQTPQTINSSTSETTSMNPKILIACPIIDTRKYCIDRYLECIRTLTYSNKELLLVDNSATEDFYQELKAKGVPVLRGKHFPKGMDALIHNRNIIRDYFLSKDFDYLFSLDSDVICTPDAIEKLLQHNKDIVSGVYYGAYIEQQKVVAKPLLYKQITPESFAELLKNEEVRTHVESGAIKQETLFRQLTREEVQEKKLISINVAGLGVVLIKRAVLEKVHFRQDPTIKASDDYFFFTDAARAGFTAYADTSVTCTHLHAGRAEEWKK